MAFDGRRDLAKEVFSSEGTALSGQNVGAMADVDVLVIGGGNAALCAAITARERGASVLMVECASREMRGGNSRHTRNLRMLHDEPTPYLTGAYLEEEFWEDLLSVTQGQTNEQLARMVIRESKGLGPWMEAHGCMFQPPLKGTLHLSRTNAHFLGGGKALINSYYRTAERLGVRILYDTEAVGIELKGGLFHKAILRGKGSEDALVAKSVVVASGGFQANLEWLEQHWGERARNFLVRGTPFNKGTMLRALLELGARPIGDPTQCHAVAIDARAPKFDGGIVTRLDCIPFGIVVNKQCRRFYDEGENFWPKRYAIWGRLVAEQPEQVAFCIIDSKSLELFIPSVFPPFEAYSIASLAQQLGLEPEGLERTVSKFNMSVKPGRFDPTVLDDCHTVDLDPPKTHWARPLDAPPFYAYPLRPGITFTYFGVEVDEKARVIFSEGGPAPNIFAAGEIMAGNILGRGYLAGFGMTIGTVFGKIAGREAAVHGRG